MPHPDSVDPLQENDSDILALINTHGDRYLVMDGRVPLMTRSRVCDEFRLYALTLEGQESVLDQFFDLTGRSLSLDSMTDELSGGQKTVLGALIALACPAPRILFVRFFDSLHPDRRRLLADLIRISRSQKKEIRELA